MVCILYLQKYFSSDALFPTAKGQYSLANNNNNNNDDTVVFKRKQYLALLHF